MGITDELRKWISTVTWLDDGMSHSHKNILAIADRIDAEYQKAIRELNNLADASVLLPVDADGEVWHIGDRTESGQTIEAMGLNKHGWHFVGTVNEIDPAIHHHHAPTVEDVLWELLGKITPLMEDDEAVPIVAAYAAKLRLANDGEEQ